MRKKKDLSTELDKNIEVTNQLEEIIADAIEGKLSEKAQNEAAEYVNKEINAVFGKIDNDEGGKLFDNLRAYPVKEQNTAELNVGEYKIIITPYLNRFELFTAISLMVNMMAGEKDRSGYRHFVQMIDDFEFMFFLSFYTNIGFHSSLDGYMQIRNLFDVTGNTRKFYAAISDSRKVVKEILANIYRLWEQEHIILLGSIPQILSSGNELSSKIMKMMPFEDIGELTAGAGDEISEKFVEYLYTQKDEPKEEALTEQDIKKKMFQRKKLDEKPVVEVLQGGKQKSKK